MLTNIIRRTFSSGPVFERIQTKLTNKLSPVVLEIRDDSHKHASHAAMRGGNKTETHFYVHIVSEEFRDKILI